MMRVFFTFAVLLSSTIERSSGTCNNICRPFLGTMQEKRCSQTYLFTAKVLRPVIPSSDPALRREYLVEIIQIYNGPHDMLPGSIITISTPIRFSECGVLPNIGMKYLLGSNSFTPKMFNWPNEDGRNSAVGTVTIRLVCDTFERLTQRAKSFLNNGACQEFVV